jgi:hypothetical protein
MKEILDSKIVRGKLKYLIDWEGYRSEERTWEPAENIQYTIDTMTEFHQYYPDRPSIKDLPQRSRRQRKI